MYLYIMLIKIKLANTLKNTTENSIDSVIPAIIKDNNIILEISFFIIFLV
jgi:hypothetical protein